ALSRRAAELDADDSGNARDAGAEGETADSGSGTSSEGSPAATAASDDPMTALLTEGWSKVLGHSRIDARSHFFHSGGHSLLAAELAAWLEPRLGARPPLRVLFRNPVLADQAEALATTALPTES
ncbi:phosphopantetheine-binding protein, partial [Streptomyces sp. NPDC054840]